MTKMTYAIAIDNAIAAMGECEASERLAALKAQLAKRGSGKHGMTKTQKENVGLKDRIVEVLADGDLAATEIAGEMGLTCQKVSALLRQLVDDEKVERVKDGKTIRFHLC